MGGESDTDASKAPSETPANLEPFPVPATEVGKPPESSQDAPEERQSRKEQTRGRRLSQILSSLSPAMHRSHSRSHGSHRRRKSSFAGRDDVSVDGISRSFAGFLTSASIYAGFKDLEREGVAEAEEEEAQEAEREEEDREEYREDTDAASLRTKFEISVKARKPELSNKKSQQLSSMLEKRFSVGPDSEFVADYPCWLMGDVLLQGHLYITSQAILFSAYLPKQKPRKIVMQGALAAKSARLHRKWAVLWESQLSLYAKSTELYFPEQMIDLRHALRAEIYHKSTVLEPVGPVWLKVVTAHKTHWFQADNMSSARSWVSAIKKQIFQARNKGDQAIVKIPFLCILDVELATVLGETSNLRIKVLENPDSYAVDDYFVLFFSRGKEAEKDIRDALTRGGFTLSKSQDDLKSKAECLKQSETAVQTTNCLEMGMEEEIAEEVPEEIADLSGDEMPLEEGSKSPLSRSSSLWGLNRVSRVAASSFSSLTHTFTASSAVSHFNDDSQGDPFYVASQAQRQKKQKTFSDHFSLPDETLIASFHAHIIRGLPLYGRLYLSTSFLCFRSTIPGTGTTMILPLTDIENASKEKGFRFGYSGLVVVIHGHEELFFEFPSEESRDDCECQLMKRLQGGKLRRVSDSSEESEHDTLCAPPDATLTSARIRLVESKLNDELGTDVPLIFEEHPLQRTDVKPTKRYRFTLLTIGSRGDVQPYIALGLRLRAEGHTVKIVTHKEFGAWIDSYGIGFDVIAGDPSELMSLMVTHPTISYSFVRDAKSKFSSWIDDLLQSSWKACQDTDVLIESPSSFAGIHIAEALQIPYFRAFTMPWSRTRAYPNAFLVPDQKLGGSYNYMTHVAFENGYWRGVSTQVNRWRQASLHLRPTNLGPLKQNSVPFLYNISPVVFPPSVDFPEWVKVTGYWFLDQTIKYTPPAELVAFIKKAKDDDKKLVYIGFGSIVVDNPRKLSESVIEAVLEADVRCILNKGWSDRLEKKDANVEEVVFPPEIYNSGTVPHDWLFSQIDAAVHHGGSGTTGASLRFGLPTVIKPFFGDQKFYASRVEDLGCGVALKELSCKSLVAALKEVTTNKRIADKAKLIGQKINAENGIQNALDAIYSEMEYARSLSVSKYKKFAMKNDSDVKTPPSQSPDPEDKGMGSWFLV